MLNEKVRPKMNPSKRATAPLSQNFKSSPQKYEKNKAILVLWDGQELNFSTFPNLRKNSGIWW